MVTLPALELPIKSSKQYCT